MRRYDDPPSPGDKRPTSRVPVTAGVSLALFLSMVAVHLYFFQRAKRDLGF